MGYRGVWSIAIRGVRARSVVSRLVRLRAIKRAVMGSMCPLRGLRFTLFRENHIACMRDKVRDGFIPGVPEKAERWTFSSLRARGMIFVYVTFYTEENDTNIIKFGWVDLIICPFLDIRSLSNFARFLRTMSEELCRE